MPWTPSMLKLNPSLKWSPTKETEHCSAKMNSNNWRLVFFLKPTIELLLQVRWNQAIPGSHCLYLTLTNIMSTKYISLNYITTSYKCTSRRYLIKKSWKCLYIQVSRSLCGPYIQVSSIISNLLQWHRWGSHVLAAPKECNMHKNSNHPCVLSSKKWMVNLHQNMNQIRSKENMKTSSGSKKSHQYTHEYVLSSWNNRGFFYQQ